VQKHPLTSAGGGDEAESALGIPIRDLSLVPHDDCDAAISFVSGHNLKITGPGSGALVVLALCAGLVSANFCRSPF
jgi:hypothetical protein